MSEPIIQPEPAPALQNLTLLGALPDGLSDKQLAAIELLLAGHTMVSIARQLSVARQTIHNWRNDERFAEVLDECRCELWSAAGARLRALVHPSLDIVESELRNPYDKARFRAATAVLRIANLRKPVPKEEDSQ